MEIGEQDASYDEDKTIWVKEKENIDLLCEVSRNIREDPALISFIERLLTKEFKKDEVVSNLRISATPKGDVSNAIDIDGEELEEIPANDIITKLRSSHNLFLHNSTQNDGNYYFRGGKPIMLYDLSLTA